MFLLLLQQLEQAVIRLKGCRTFASHGALSSGSAQAATRTRSVSAVSTSPRAYDGRESLSKSSSQDSAWMAAKTQDAAS